MPHSTSPSLPIALVVEPNESLALPYTALSRQLHLHRVSSVPAALRWLSQHTPDIFFLSTSFSMSLQLQLLEAFKNSFGDKIIPLALVVDVSQPMSSVPGTVWGDKLLILHSRQTAALKELLRSVM